MLNCDIELRAAGALTPRLHVVIHLVTHRKNASDLDADGGCVRPFDIGRLAKVGGGDPIGVTWWPLHQLDPVAVGVTEP